MILPQHGMLGGPQAPVLFLNAGQSNDEKGQLLTNVDLTAPYQVPFPEVQYWGADDAWHTMDYSDQDSYQAPLNGVTLNYANQFYLYPQLAAALKCTAKNPLYVCSWSVGDTDLETDWISDGSGTLYNEMVARINDVIADLEATYGMRPYIFCFLWDQGEADGRSSPGSAAYDANLQDFVDDLRIAINEPNLRFHMPLIKLGSINGVPNAVSLGSIVNAAKRNVAVLDGKIITQDTNYFEPSTDGVHFTVQGQSDKNDGQIQDFIDAGWITGVHSPSPPSGQKYFNGYNNFVRFGDILDATFAAVDGTFRLGITVWNPPFYSARTLVSKFTSTGNQRQFHWIISGSTIQFNYYMVVGTGARVRGITWTGLTGLYDGNEHTLELRYNGALDTNAGLDRPDLYVDGALYTTGKTLSVNTGTIGDIFSSTAQLAVGALVDSTGAMSSTAFVIGGWAKDFFVQTGAGSALITCPDLATGTDTSGNGNNGTFEN